MPEIIPIDDEKLGPIGYVAIDSTIRGQAGGGLRMHADLDETELAALARTMTLKYGFYGIPKGGAKGGIRFDPEEDRSRVRRRIAAFGRAIRPLMETRRYFPGPDLGTSDAEIRYLIEESGLASRDRLLWDTSRSGRYTAAGVAASVLRAAEHLGVRPGKCAVQVEGLGAVGLPLAEMLAARGVRVVAVSNRHGTVHRDTGIDMGKLKEHLAESGGRLDGFAGAEPIGREEFIALPTTALLPCALSFSLGSDDAGRLRCRAVVPGANAPFAPGAREIARAAGITVLPDFVANAGGVLGGALAFGALAPRAVEESVADLVGGAAGRLLNRATETGEDLRELAERIALHRFERMKKAPASRLLLLGLALRRRGLVPAAAARIFARRFAARLEGELAAELSTTRSE